MPPLIHVRSLSCYVLLWVIVLWSLDVSSRVQELLRTRTEGGEPAGHSYRRQVCLCLCCLFLCCGRALKGDGGRKGDATDFVCAWMAAGRSIISRVGKTTFFMKHVSLLRQKHASLFLCWKSWNVIAPLCVNTAVRVVTTQHPWMSRKHAQERERDREVEEEKAEADHAKANYRSIITITLSA